ncbi:RAD52 motif-containing protein 1 isoform X2 [Eurytemora carolleeae]|uniref:RAD52 motif-containing protein 1 isoform X2 n=1 Tax=Eurytemora carolleeae TaxID=1294199 RepID=UPI000C77BA02|nr:RAD52 motif-containing protein 1 isoform X2 [Eurytemora carolleeae]|eukprot:XP_023321738.1 RAD52 motif-containing protein 1-like isoform X2 [Eurytemora affinis]
MVDVEIIEMYIPNSPSTLIYIPGITSSLTQPELYSTLHQTFSKFGLLYQVSVKNVDSEYYTYIRYYSARAASRARAAALRGEIAIKDSGPVRVTGLSRSGFPNVPLSRYKCEELANFYLGFSGWRSKVLYHRKEESDPLMVKYVSVVSLEFPRDSVSCEGAGLCEQPLASEEEGDSYIDIITKTAKRSLGEAFLAAWGKVLLIVVEGSKVQVQINTTKEDQFLYNPVWDEPVVSVSEVEYTQDAENEDEV